MKLSEITKDEFKQKLVDPVKAEFLKRLEQFRSQINGYQVRVEEGPPLTIVCTYVGPGFRSIKDIKRELITIASSNVLEIDFLAKNDIGYKIGTDGAITVAWEIYF